MMRKVIFSTLLCSILVLSMIGCGTTSTAAKNDSATKQVKENDKKEAPAKEDAKKAQPPVTIDQLPVSLTIKQPDSIGNVYMDATYTNNSDKNITGYRIKVLLKDSNKTTNLLNSDTVLPGETSPKFEAFGPKTLNKDDVELLEYTIKIANDDGTTTSLTYDCKLKQYK